MISPTPRSRSSEARSIPTAGSNTLHARLMYPKPPVCPKRLVFIPPLVGAGASQPLVIFRNLTRRGAVLMSFEYRGHPRSSGDFELDGTIEDTQYALRWASDYARAHALPLHGFATCFGVIALAAQFARGRAPAPLWSFSAVSGLFRLDHVLKLEEFAAVFARYLGGKSGEKSLLEGIRANAIDWEADAFRGALHDYLSGLFPELRVERDRFEELHYDRVSVARTLGQLVQARYLENLDVPRDVPCHFFYGRRDDVLSLHHEPGRAAYRDHVWSLVPHAVFYECEIDHFGRGPEHDPVIEKLADLFEESEARAARVWEPPAPRHPESVRR